MRARNPASRLRAVDEEEGTRVSTNSMTAIRHSIVATLARSTPALKWVFAGTLAIGLFSMPVLAQGSGAAFCDTQMAETIKNAFSVVQFGGPLVGGLLALGATVSMPMIRRADLKKELKEIRNQGVVWGIIVAPLATVIIQFILNNVVAGGTSCGF